MKFSRKATANWTGGKEGKGKLSTDSGVLKDSQYGFKSRFEEGKGTNPEELVGAAHAGCFSMKLAIVMETGGHPAENIDTEAKVVFEDGAIKEVQLTTKVKADVDEAKFKEFAEDAKKNCPISKLLKADIKLNASLV